MGRISRSVLKTPEHSLDLGEGLVGGHDVTGVEGVWRQACADDVDPIEGGLGGDLVLVAAKAERVVCDVEDEALGHLVVIDHLADPQPDLVLASQRAALAAACHRDRFELSVGRGQQRLAFACPLLGQERVLASHEALAWVVRVGDLDEVGLIEKRQLDGARLDQRGDGRGAQRRDPVQLRGGDVFDQAGLGEHAAVADHTEVADREALLEFLAPERPRWRGRRCCP